MVLALVSHKAPDQLILPRSEDADVDSNVTLIQIADGVILDVHRLVDDPHGQVRVKQHVSC